MPPPKRLLLVGAGHAHAFVLEAFAQRPDPTISLTVVSDSPLAAYSGGVPAWLAGECTLRDTQLDIAALCQRAGARLITSPAVALCPTKRQVTLQDGHVVAFDVASLNVGATLQPPQHAENAERTQPALLAMRPLGSLHHRWQALLDVCHLLVLARPGYNDRMDTPELQQWLERHRTADPALLAAAKAALG